MAQVARVQTPVTLPQFASSMRDSMVRLGYGNPSAAAIAVAWSHYDEETGGGKATWNYNLGNRRWFGGTDPPDYVSLSQAWECGDSVPDGATPISSTSCPAGQVAYIPAGGNYFAAWNSLSDGMDAYLRFLHDHYPEAFAAMIDGQPAGFSHGLKMRGYYTSDEGVYTSILQKIFDATIGQIPSDKGPIFAGVAALGVLLAWKLARRPLAA